MKRIVCFVLALSCAGFAEDGAALYKKHCATCHESSKAHAPSFQALQAMSEDSILQAMESGAMWEPASGLNTQERKTVAAYLTAGATKVASANTPAATCPTGALGQSASGQSWNGFGAGLTNARFQTNEAAGLSVEDIPKLRLKWAFRLSDVPIARGQPVVVGNRLFAGASDGKVYALDPKSGCTYWVFQADAAIRSGVVAEMQELLPRSR